MHATLGAMGLDRVQHAEHDESMHANKKQRRDCGDGICGAELKQSGDGWFDFK